MPTVLSSSSSGEGPVGSGPLSAAAPPHLQATSALTRDGAAQAVVAATRLANALEQFRSSSAGHLDGTAAVGRVLGWAHAFDALGAFVGSVGTSFSMADSGYGPFNLLGTHASDPTTTHAPDPATMWATQLGRRAIARAGRRRATGKGIRSVTPPVSPLKRRSLRSGSARSGSARSGSARSGFGRSGSGRARTVLLWQRRGLRPAAARIAADAPSHFAIRSTSGVARRRVAGTKRMSDHATGRAVDFAVTPRGVTGDRLAAWAIRQPSVKYVIWNRRIWTPRRGWHRYVHPGVRSGAVKDSPTLRHEDHVHVSVY